MRRRDRHAAPARPVTLTLITARALLLVAFACAAAMPPVAHAGALLPEDSVFRLGSLARQPYGESIAGLGDVNGDGLADTAVLEEVPGPDGRAGPSVRVVLGSRSAPAAGFAIAGAPDAFPDDDAGGLRDANEVAMSVAAAGDVNGDGLADVLVGAAALGNSLRRRSGSAFVVFGRRDVGDVRLDALGDGGFRIDGPNGGSGLGGRVAGLGDVNDDGRSDLALGSNRAAWVVFGKPDGALVDLRDPRGGAYPIANPDDDPSLFDEHTVGAAGDANGDGRGDVLISVGGRIGRPQGVWVVFGKPDAGPVDLRRLGGGGYAITGADVEGIDPHSGGGAGDVDGDGLGDVVISAAETAWVVHGRRAGGRVQLRRDPGVLTIANAADELEFSFPAAGVGDANGDGLDDLAFGDPDARGSCRTGAGRLTVVHGRRGGGTIDARRLGGAGFRLLGDESGAGLGAAFAAAGDVNGDGRPDLALDVGSNERRELRVVTLADTRRAPPRRGRCLIVRAISRSLRQIRRERRVRVRVTVKEASTVLVSPDVAKCDRRECWLDPNPDFTSRVVRFPVPGTKTVSIRIGRRTLRELRRPHVTDLTVCAGEVACVDYPTGRRRG